MSGKVKMSMPKPLVALVTAASVAVVGGAAVTTAVLLNNNNSNISDTENEDNGNNAPAVTIGFEQNGVVVMEDDDFAAMMEEAQRQASEGMMDLSYKTTVISVDGVNFECDFGNPISNPYYMYFNIYLDGEEILRTGLVEPGMELNSFKSSVKLAPGAYEAVMVFTQVEDDMATLCGQVMVAIDVVVYDGVPGEDDEFVSWNTDE